jgi:hypothetical protein
MRARGRDDRVFPEAIGEAEEVIRKAQGGGDGVTADRRSDLDLTMPELGREAIVLLEKSGYEVRRGRDLSVSGSRSISSSSMPMVDPERPSKTDLSCSTSSGLDSDQCGVRAESSRCCRAFTSIGAREVECGQAARESCSTSSRTARKSSIALRRFSVLPTPSTVSSMACPCL